MVQFLAFTHCKGSKHSPFFLHAQGFIQDFPFGGGGGNRGGWWISIYEKEGSVMKKRGEGDKSLCQ